MTDFDLAAIHSLFFLGHQPDHPERPIIYPKDPKQRPHLAYYGTTRSGKTFGIEYVLRQLAETRGAGFLFVDPHGSGYWRMASYLRQVGVTDRVLFWDLNDPDYVTTYDPFGFPDHSPSYIAGNLTSTLLATLGRQAEASEQALLKTTTEAGLMSLLALGLPFALARELFDPQDVHLKRSVAELLNQHSLLSAVTEMRLLERYHELAPAYRRLDNLFRDPRLRCTFALAGVNFRTLMDEGWIVLVNAEPRDQSDEAVTLYIRLLVKTLLMAAKQRDKADDTAPFFLAIDEASRYLTADTARILAETAGYGLYLLVGMQSLEQARIESEESYVSLRANVNGEIVMRLIDHEEKLYFAQRFFGDGLDFSRPKHEEVNVAAVPHTVEHPTRTRSMGTTTDPERRVVRSESEQSSGGYHTEYDYLESRTPYFYTPDELERLEARRFGLRTPGRAQRFGIARVNEHPATEIEIPELSDSMYDRHEMAPWLWTFKATQPFTVPLVEAQRRFDALVSQKLESITTAVNQANYDERRISTRPPLIPTTRLAPAGEKLSAERPRGKKGRKKADPAER